MVFLVQFGINKHEYIFQRLTKLHEPVGRVQFGVFEKFKSAYLFLIAREKSCDYLIICMKKFRDGQAEETHAYHAIRGRIQGARLIWKQKILLAICEFL